LPPCTYPSTRQATGLFCVQNQDLGSLDLGCKRIRAKRKGKAVNFAFGLYLPPPTANRRIRKEYFVIKEIITQGELAPKAEVDNYFEHKPEVSLDDFLAAFYPNAEETIRIRIFEARGAPKIPKMKHNYEAYREEGIPDESSHASLRELNNLHGVYFIVNAGGHEDKDITRYTAFFAECDDGSLIEQHAKLDASPIASSIRVETKKSVHAYWLIEGDCDEQQWRDVQARLIAYFGSDPTIKNPSRAMRLPCFNHVTYNGVNDYSYKLVEVVQFAPSKRYTVEKMLSAFPALAQEKEESLTEALRSSVTSSESFVAWQGLHEETKRRLLSMRPLTKDSNGEWGHVKGICHDGKGDTGIYVNLNGGGYGCHKGCEPADIRRALGLPERPLSSSNSSNSQSSGSKGKAFPKLDREKALYGLAGDIVLAIEPHSEADPVALLVQLLVAFGNLTGRSAHFVAEADRHYTNLFAVIVGDSSRGRKGSSLGHVRRLLEEADENWAGCITGGLTSGEGLVHHVRDECDDFMPGAIRESKRALVIESEFASVLRVQKRDGNTLSTLIRQAWDTGMLNVMRRNSPDKATNAHISIIGHITSDELKRCLQDTDAVNGYANRFLWVWSRRSKKLPEGGHFDQTDAAPLIRRLKDAAEFARGVGVVKRDEEARKLWREIYGNLDDEISSGRLGSILSRAEAQIMRLACIYALLDCSSVVKRVHLEAAKAVWDYCVASSRYIFGEHSLSKKAQKIYDRLSETGDKGLNKTELLKGNGGRSFGLNVALAELEQAGFARMMKVPTAGRDEERWFVSAVIDERRDENDEFDEESPNGEDLSSSNSSGSAQRAA
jgi:hypothetical protein